MFPRFTQLPRCVVWLCVLLGSVLTAAHAAPPTTAIAELAPQKQFYSLPNFKLGGRYRLDRPASHALGGEGGTTLESLGHAPLRLAYMTTGTPHYGKDGRIDNAIVVNAYYSGDSANMMFFWQAGQAGVAFSEGAVIGPGQLIDTNRYFVIYLDSIGLFGASRPSDGLGMRFPDYSYFDIVQANYRLLHDHLKVGRIRLTTGVSMGGALAYVWAVLHPEYVDAILPVGGNSYADNVARWTFQLMTAALESDPVWQATHGDYYALPPARQPKLGQQFAWSILERTALDFDARSQQPWSEVRQYVFGWQPQAEDGRRLAKRAEDFDLNDLLVRNRTCLPFNINALLPKIRAKTLILHVTNDQWVMFAEVARLAATIPHARLLSYESPLAHYGSFAGPNRLKGEVLRFMQDIGLPPGLVVPRSTEQDIDRQLEGFVPG